MTVGHCRHLATYGMDNKVPITSIFYNYTLFYSACVNSSSRHNVWLGHCILCSWLEAAVKRGGFSVLAAYLV